MRANVLVCDKEVSARPGHESPPAPENQNLDPSFKPAR